MWKVGFMMQGMVRVPGGAEKTVGIHSDQCPLYLLQDKDPGGSRCRQVINARPQIPGLQTPKESVSKALLTGALNSSGTDSS